MPPIRLHNLTLGYDRHPAVHHLAGTFASGSMTAIVGPNGSGKSTLVKGIIGFLPPLEGTIDRGGLKIRDFAYLPQHLDADQGFPITVRDAVLLGLWRETGMFSGLKRTHWQRVAQALSMVGLTGFEHSAINELSGGQLQRVMFARLLLQDAPVLLLDEPFNGIDEQTTADLLAVLQRWHTEGRTILAVLHNLALVRTIFPQTLLLARQAVAWGKTEHVLTEPHLRIARTMAEAWDHSATICRQVAA